MARCACGRDGEDGERECAGPDALAGALDAVIHETVRMTVLVVVVFMALVVLVRTCVGMGVTQGAVTVQVAVDEFISGGRHGQVSVECACIVDLDR
jgi:hypothetical protein